MLVITRGVIISFFAAPVPVSLPRRAFDTGARFAYPWRPMNSLRAPGALFLMLVFVLAVAGAERRPITPQDLWACKRLASPALSPDGRTAVFAVQEWSVEKNRSTTHLWLVDLAGGEPRRLTSAATATDGSPVWSPDGRRVAFVSKRGDDEVAALYVIRTDGGEPEKLVELPYGVSKPTWLPDGRAIIVATQVIPELAGKLTKADLAAMKKEVKRRKDSKVTAKVTEDRAFRYWDHWLTDNLASRLVRVDVETKGLLDLTPQRDRLFQFSGEVSYDVSPDGRQVAVAMNSTPSPYRDNPNLDVSLVPTDGSGTMKLLTSDNRGDDTSPVFAPDGKTLVFARTTTPYYSGESRRLWRHDLATGANTPLTDKIDLSFDEAAFAPDGRTLWVIAEEKGVVPLFRLNADGTGLAPAVATGTCGSLDVRGGAAVFLHDTANRPAELFALDPVTGAVRQLTHFNDTLLATIDLGRVEPYWFTGAAGDRIHGWLTLPPKFDPAKPYPLVQLMHGGPHTMCRDTWSYRWNAHQFAAPGYVVTWINRHGSTGFGERFARSILNEWGEKPLEDILKGTDHLLQKLPNLDPKRMAAAGGSYGGYMAAWVAGHTDRFACLIDHAGVNDLVTQYGADTTNYSFSQVLGGTPWANPEGMQRNNPMTFARNFKTPMLIIHGELDYRVPYVNGTALYGVLQSMGVPSRLVVFPNENHWVLTPQNSIYWNYEVQAWLARYLGGRPMTKPVFDAEEKPAR
jgi:dipeptidyl aminopeptidase/acylaminoacyl peptidase